MKSSSSNSSSAPTSRASEYRAFAFAYDQALGERFFGAVRGLLDDALARLGKGSGTHLDVACGTGYVVEHCAGLGFVSTGLDLSLSMLTIARRRAQRLVVADVRDMPFRGTFARITCFYDSLNHMQERAELTASFSAVLSVMDDESLFLFDMNHPDIYPAVWGMREPYVSSGDDHHLEIATTFRSRQRLGIARITGWARLGGNRIRIDEVHRQFAWNETEIEESLAAGGLEVVEKRAFDPFDESADLDGRGVKLFYVCRRA